MRKTIIKSLALMFAISQVATAQNSSTAIGAKDRINNDIFGADSTKLESYVGQFDGTAPTKSSQATSVSRPMNQDSTNLIPNNIVIPVTNTYTAPTVVIPPQNGSCGASNGSIVTSSPTSFLCSIGIPTGVTNNGGSYSWSCSGNNYGNPSNVASCSAQQRVVGQCGSDNGQTMSSTPTNLCASGTPSSVSSNGTSYSWSCNGNYGAPASCSANKPALPSQCGGFDTLDSTINGTGLGEVISVTSQTSYVNGSACPGGYIPVDGSGNRVLLLDYSPFQPFYTTDGTYDYVGNHLPGFYPTSVHNTVNGLSSLISKTQNAKIGCPPSYHLEATAKTLLSPYWMNPVLSTDHWFCAINP